MNTHRLTPVAAAAALAAALSAATAAAQEAAPVKDLGVVTILSSRPSSLPTQIPTTMQSIQAADIAATINATDSEDALKYFPSLLVRKRYEGDYNHAMLSSRASGTGNPARSAVYADGILLSNYLGNSVSGLSFPPRWGMVTPEQIERVDVMYGPFSAAYPGNSVGAVVDYVTRMPSSFEAHAKLGYTVQPFKLYNTDSSYRAWQSSASLGSRAGDWSWFIDLNHTDSQGQPLTFATRTQSSGTTPNGGTVVNGAVADRNTSGDPIWVIGTGTQYHTKQDHLKLKLAYDLSPTLRASYLLGVWENRSEGRPTSYLTNASTGQAVSSGAVVIGGRQYAALTGSDFALTDERLTHGMHGFSLKSHTQGAFDWEVATSVYDYQRDQKRQNASSATLPSALDGGAGTLADGAGTGWQNLALRGTWRPGGGNGGKGEHVVDFGYQYDHYALRYRTSSITGNWRADAAGATASNVRGDTQLDSLYVQDTWRFAPGWLTVLGLRGEHWQAHDGRTEVGSSYRASWPQRSGSFLSPKGALSWQLSDAGVVKASLGRALRMPTVAELYGATSTANSQYINDPNLRPERSWTSELSYERRLDAGQWRLTYFRETTRDGLFSQTILDTTANKTVSRVQNVGRIETQGLETAVGVDDVLLRGLDLNGSLTYTDSVIKENDGFVATAGDTIGKQQPNIPHWRATAVASYRVNAAWTGTLAARYSGRQYRTLNNADVNGDTYMGVTKFFVVDLRTRYQIDRAWSLAAGIDNLANCHYWNFHPYPQRSYHAELRYDLR
ncbi:MAG TPA: TonB-dependent receptor [Burkholderiaceae bacterium]|nr:TonB-dependent receptor [Burkholderiaceae bacterium]HNB43200.1 TonB-dependent receptor [Burkholderiaceae bacterium]